MIASKLFAFTVGFCMVVAAGCWFLAATAEAFERSKQAGRAHLLKALAICCAVFCVIYLVESAL